MRRRRRVVLQVKRLKNVLLLSERTVHASPSMQNFQINLYLLIFLIQFNCSNIKTPNVTRGLSTPKCRKGKAAKTSMINPDWDFEKMGIGGLNKEFGTILRRVIFPRLFPSNVIEKLDYNYAKGLLLYGPPGTGKTLMARKIGQMLNSKEPKIVNGPEILNKYVGESEANIRNLFADAEEEQKTKGDKSLLHLIIIDEIDAICKARGSVVS